MSDTETTVEEVINDEEIDTTDDANDEKTRLLGKYGVDIESFDENDLLKTLRRIEKAETLTVAQKKKLKELESKSSETPSDVMTKADYAMEKFLDKNPELEAYKDELSKYTSKGLSYDEAKTLILNSDKTKQAREKVNSLGLSEGEPNKGTKTYSDDDLVALSKKDINAYNKVMSDIESGKAKHK